LVSAPALRTDFAVATVVRAVGAAGGAFIYQQFGIKYDVY